jgi:hypothetical protein
VTGKVGRLVLFALLASFVAGCGPTGLDTTYGRSRGESINGTSGFAELLRERGHEVRTASRATETLAEWADVVVRFSPHPGLPDNGEGEWFEDWLEGRTNRSLVYVVRDFDAEADFWDAVLAASPKDATPERLERVKKKRDVSKPWVGDLPPKPKEPAGAAEWFTVDPKPPAPTTCKTLEGPWAAGVVANAAAVSRHEVFQVEQGEDVLLAGDGSTLAMAWTVDSGSRVLAVANASFLLNAALLNRARRPLVLKVADWIGPPPLHVAFVEGARPFVDPEDEGADSPFHLLGVPPFDVVAPQLLGFLLLLVLSYAARLGRPLPEPPSGIERPSAHPEALGALLARTRQADAARFLLETYRRWRHPALTAGRKNRIATPSSSSRRAPRESS